MRWFRVQRSSGSNSVPQQTPSKVAWQARSADGRTIPSRIAFVHTGGSLIADRPRWVYAAAVRQPVHGSGRAKVRLRRRPHLRQQKWVAGQIRLLRHLSASRLLANKDKFGALVILFTAGRRRDFHAFSTGQSIRKIIVENCSPPRLATDRTTLRVDYI